MHERQIFPQRRSDFISHNPENRMHHILKATKSKKQMLIFESIIIILIQHPIYITA